MYIRPLDNKPDQHYITDEGDVDQIVPAAALAPLKRGDKLNVDGFGQVTYIRQVQNQKPFSIYVTTQSGSDEMVKFSQVTAESVSEADNSIDEAAVPGDYELEVETKVFFERGSDGTPVVQKIMLGNTDITSIVDPEETASNIEEDETSPVDGIEYINVDIDYTTYGKYYPATREEPAEYPEVELTDITAFGNGKSLPIPANDLSSSDLDYLQEKAEEMAADGGSDDYDDYDDRRDMYDDQDVEKQSSGKSNVQELAEFIKSFYDKDSGTFPKGPEGVCTMVGKKFGEQAEQVARKFVERMAPQQATDNNPELQELARIKQLSGM
jgi:hypothetical protein